MSTLVSPYPAGLFPVVNAVARGLFVAVLELACAELLISTLLVVAAAETTISKVSLTESVPSLAVTFTETVSTSAAVGVPEKVRVAAAKLSHAGRAELSDWVAV